MNHIATEWLIIWNRLGGWEFFEHDGVEYDCVGGSLKYDFRDKSNLNETDDQYIVLNHWTMGGFLKL